MLVVFSLLYCLPAGWAALGLFAYGLACIWQWMQLAATRWAWSVQSLRVDVFGHMTFTNALGQTWSFRVLADTVVHPACIVIHLTDLVQQQEVSAVPDHPRQKFFTDWLHPKRLLILPDQADASSLKALRAWLKWGAHEH
ncbi:hypothetical protein [Methylophilus sp. 5]|uniref:hypothetical protein n=1 Tax=Methylophilus sp. 5 TaxID=1112274 RepID=UPI0004900DE6|nr:hypothetical protein [Methylophilus sp. 5]